VIIAGGGTGGHFFPALAVAQALVARHPCARVLFVGTSRGIEARLAPRNGFSLRTLTASGFAGVGILKRLEALASLPVALAQSVWILIRFRPGAVVGVGGYASFPMGLAAGLGGFPLLLLEQNVSPGLANRLLKRAARVVAVAFPQTLAAFPGKGRLMGNPVRASLTAVGPEAEPQAPLRLLVFGGSRGARAVNEAFVQAAPRLAAFPGGIEILHQTGADDVERVRRAYAAAGIGARVEPFIDAMEEAYAWCHACVCRAGATTVAELAAVRRPALLVPFPHAAGDHQTLNARGLAELGAALWADQARLDTESLLGSLEKLADPLARRSMAAKLAAVARPRAAEEIAGLVAAMAGGGA
jgi:UDP-N-acetylglucosamine--N-acetylmuramyl-(pentapeptide) pyrophosphoryl-undecaprenol N-acetylglucosamine transferase